MSARIAALCPEPLCSALYLPSPPHPHAQSEGPKGKKSGGPGGGGRGPCPCAAILPVPDPKSPWTRGSFDPFPLPSGNNQEMPPPPHTSHISWSIPRSGQLWWQRGAGGSGVISWPPTPPPCAPGASQTLSREWCDSRTPPAPQLCPRLCADPSHGSCSMPMVSPRPAAPRAFWAAAFLEGCWDEAAPEQLPWCTAVLCCFRRIAFVFPHSSGTACAPGPCPTPVPQFPSCWAELCTCSTLPQSCAEQQQLWGSHVAAVTAAVSPAGQPTGQGGEGRALCTLICFFPRYFWAVFLLPPSRAELESGKYLSLLGCRGWGLPSVVASLGATWQTAVSTGPSFPSAGVGWL